MFHEKDQSFAIDDGYQSPVMLTSVHREVLAATFYKFLLKNIGTYLYMYILLECEFYLLFFHVSCTCT